MKEEKYKFTNEEVKELMKGYKVLTPERALECWARFNYPIDKGIYYIKRVGKSYIIIGEYV